MIESGAVKILGFIVAAASVGSIGAGLFVLERDYDQLNADSLQQRSEITQLRVSQARIEGAFDQDNRTKVQMSKIIKNQSEIVKVLNER